MGDGTFLVVSVILVAVLGLGLSLSPKLGSSAEIGPKL